MKQTDFAIQVSNFFTLYLPTRRDLSENTVISYRDAFKLLLKYAEEQKHIKAEKFQLSNLTEPFVSDFINWLRDARRNCPATQKQRLAAIDVFVKYLKIRVPDYLLEYQRIQSIQVAVPKRTDIGHFTPVQLQEVFAEPDPLDKFGRRDRVMLSLMYDCAARVQEICDLTVKDLQLHKPYCVEITGKGNKTAKVPLMKETADILKEYLHDCGLDKPECCNMPVFTNHRGEKLTRAGVTYILKKYSDEARKKDPSIPVKVSPHMLRHSKAMHMLQAGVYLIYIRDFLRHSQVATTEVYAKADVEMRRKVIEEASPKVVSGLPDWSKDQSIMDFLQSI